MKKYSYYQKRPGIARRAFVNMSASLVILANSLGASLPFLLSQKAAAAIPVAFSQGFESDTSGWVSGGGYGSITRVPSGTGGIASAEGSWHASVANDPSGPYTQFGGYRNTWTGAWEASLDVYLDPAWADGSGFDYSVAANNASGNHRRDFIFHVAKDASTGQLLVGGSNNSGSGVRTDIETINHYAVPSAGWYTLKHTFRNNAGTLAVDLQLLNTGGTVLFTETRNDVSDLVPTLIGGNRYGWFSVLNVANGLAIDGSELAINEQVPTTTACQVSASLVTTDLDTWNTSETRANGHNQIVDDGLHIWTDFGVTGSPDPRKAAGYYATDFPLSGTGNQTIAASIDYQATAGITPGLQLVTDFDNNGTPDGILVGEAVYGNSWWLSTSSAPFVQTNAPNTGGGYGSAWYGTINEWLAKFPDARVKAIGYSLGSGVDGDGILKRISLGCVDYTFDLEPDTEPECTPNYPFASNAPRGATGTTKNGGAILPERSDVENAYGAPDGIFVSFGVDGGAVFVFNGYVNNVAGTDLTIYEITNGRDSYPEEKANIEVSQNGIDWQPVGTASSLNANGQTAIDFDATGYDWIQYIHVMDATNFAPHIGTADGFDLDAIVATSLTCSEPETPEPCQVTLFSDTTNTVAEKGGANAQALSFVHSAWTADIPGATWIWGDNPVADPTNETTQTFQKVFGWSGGVAEAKIKVAADNDFELYVNGTLVGSDNSGWSFSGALEYDIASYIVQGNNTIEIKVTNWEWPTVDAQTNPAGLLYAATIVSTEDEGCDPPVEETPTATIIATKLVCDTEDLLPNLSQTGATIGANTANQYLVEGCVKASGWQFDWKYPDGSWSTTAATDGTGAVSFTVDLSNQPSRIEMREVEQDGYIPFTWDAGNNVSAEFYCHTDVAGYDNWDWINNPVAGETYYCIAFNVPEVRTYDVKASKVICKTEADLPNWGEGDADITASTAADYVAASGGDCWLADWTFEWSKDGAGNPGDNLANGGSGWTGFSGTTALSADETGSRIWVREVTSPSYIPFTGQNTTQDESAEIYCHNDVLNYDNWEYIDVQNGGEYHCVAFNVLKPAVLSATKIVCDDEAYLPNWGAGGPDITATTATDFLADEENDEHCNTVEWNFQYRLSNEAAYNGAYGELEGWTTFMGSAPVYLDGSTTIQVREVSDEDYIPFTGWTTEEGENGSAEIYCHTDVLNYDNWEWIQNPQPDTTYYCVAWNVPEDNGNTLGDCDLDGDQVSDEDCEDPGDDCEVAENARLAEGCEDPEDPNEPNDGGNTGGGGGQVLGDSTNTPSNTTGTGGGGGGQVLGLANTGQVTFIGGIIGTLVLAGALIVSRRRTGKN